MRFVCRGALTLLVLISVGCMSMHAQAPSLQLSPIDEAATDPSLTEFRRTLVNAVRDRDVDRVLRTMTPSLAKSWKGLWGMIPIDQLGSGGAWVELGRLLAMGGTFTTTRGAIVGRREFCAPYVYSAYPKKPLPEGMFDDVDPWVILGDKIPVYAERKVSSTVLIYLSYSIVRTGGGLLGPEPDGTFWAPISLPDNREGFVGSTQIRSPSDYHACFAKMDGQWRMTTFARDVSPQ